MKTFDSLQNFFKIPLHQAAQMLGYDISNIYILTDNEEALRKNCPQIYKNLLSCEHNKDSRTPMEYARDIVASWIFEDSIIHSLKQCGLDICHAGADKARIILPNSKVSSRSDAKVFTAGIETKLEIMCDYGGFWSRYGVLHLRDDKFLGLSRENALLLGFDTANRQYLFIDFSKPVKAKFIKSHRPYGGKPAYEISVRPDYPLMPLYFEGIINDIRSAVLARNK